MEILSFLRYCVKVEDGTLRPATSGESCEQDSFFCRKILARKVRHTFKVKEIGEVFVNFVVFC